jgi:hypothetical protein
VRIALVTLGAVLAISSCGLADDTSPEKSKKQKAAARAERQKQRFIDSCVEYVPTMAFLGDRQSITLWQDANEKKKRLRAACTEIAESKPKQRTRLEGKFAETEAFLAENEESSGDGDD